MKGSKASKVSFVLVLTLLLTLFTSTTAAGQKTGPDQGDIAIVTVKANEVSWQPQVEGAGFVLTISGPGDFYLQREYQPGDRPTFSPKDNAGDPLTDGSYTYELFLLPVGAPAVSDDAQRGLVPGGIEPLVLSGNVSILGGRFVTQDATERTSSATEPRSMTPLAPSIPTDQLIYDDLIVTGSACIGFDCVNGESFGFDTLRLKENNLRIRFYDTSSTASFPTNDWQITANDSANGGANKFSIDDIDHGRTPFTIEASAPSHSLYVEDYGRVGLGTSTPVVELHIKDSDTPTTRLEQDGSGGWSPQTWDLAGNESNFFIRDVTNGSKLPFRIQPGAPSNSLSIKSDGKVGIGTWSPNWTLHTQDDSSADVRIRLDNTKAAATANTAGFDFGVMTTAQARTSVYMRAGFSDVTDATRTSRVFFRTYDGGAEQNILTFAGSDVGIGTESPNYTLEVNGSAGKPGGGSWSDSSDARLKENIHPIDGREALALFNQLQGVTFEWVNPEQHSTGTRAGLLAQELEKVFPDWVEEIEVQGNDQALIPEGERAKALHFPHDFNAYVIEAIKALDAQNQALSDVVQEQGAMIVALQQQNSDLEARLSALEKATGATNNQIYSPSLGGLFLGSLVVAAVIVNQRRKQ